ncbi:MAG: addiction module antitoxin RelB [Deltaproteobacteria bacterium RIFOXYD12_FULL_57_12]|nr:MAG: addiction module antitoxin RelB [Deltaproteobacteria bacterium RIFOXYD12_FULL_57_12]
MKYKLERTEQYDKWFARLKDRTIKLKVLARLARVENGNFGDFSQLGENLFELRFFFAGGLRIYYTIQDGAVVLLQAGGDKSTQARDIAKAVDILHGGLTHDH